MTKFYTILDFTKFFVDLLLQFFQNNNLQKGGNFFDIFANIGKGQLEYDKERRDENVKRITQIGTKFQKFNTDLNKTLSESLIKTLADLRLTVFSDYYNIINIQSFNLFKHITNKYIDIYDDSTNSLEALREAIAYIENIINILSDKTSDLDSISSSTSSIKDGGNIKKKKNINKKKFGGEVISSLILLAILSLFHNILVRELNKFTDELMSKLFENQAKLKDNSIISGGNTIKNIKFKNI